MKIHSLSFRKNDKQPKKDPITNNPIQQKDIKEENKERNDKTKLNQIKLNYDKNMLKKEKPKDNVKHDKSENNKNNKNNKNKNIEKIENQNHNIMVPQKILKLDKKAMPLKRKSQNAKNIKLYQNALLDNFQSIIINNNQQKKNKRKKLVSNAEVQIDLQSPNNQNDFSIFNNYRSYQKEFFDSAYNLNVNNYKTLYQNNQRSSSITPNQDGINNQKIKNISHRLLRNKSYNSFVSKPISNILQRKNHGDLPILLNAPVTFIKNFKSNSEKERDERNSNALLRLRDFLDIYWDKRIELVTEFFATYQIYGEDYYKYKSLENFSHYIYDNISKYTNVTKGIIETRIPMKEIIDKGIKYKNYSLRKIKYSKSLAKLINKDIKKNNNLFTPNTKKDKKKLNNYLNNNISFRRSRTIEKIDNNKNGCFYNDNYINNDYQISENEKMQKIKLNERVEKLRKYLNKNYGVNIYNKFMRKYNQDEKVNYFSKRKVGTIDIPDKDNLVNNINKQSNFYKLKSTSFSIRKNPSIHTFSEKDYKELYNELNEAKLSYINYGKENDKDKDKNKKDEEYNIWLKMYEDVKKNKFEKHPEIILKKKKKLLEYIIFQNIQERKEFEKDLLKK